MRTLILFAVLSAMGCAYPRGSTHVTPVPAGHSTAGEAPANMYGLHVIEGAFPDKMISGLPWDDDGTGPDPFVRIYIDGRLIWESDPIRDTTHPKWNLELDRNIVVSPKSQFRFEVWDFDTGVSANPMGHIERTGLPANALPGAVARLQLDNKASATILVTEAKAQRGMGLDYEIHSDGIKVLAVQRYSPAARAGIKVGERIVGIGAERVAHLSDKEAASRLSLASERSAKLAVTDAEGKNERTVQIDNGHLWLAY
jgi:hypothetical protein